MEGGDFEGIIWGWFVGKRWGLGGLWGLPECLHEYMPNIRGY